MAAFGGQSFMWNRIADIWCNKMHNDAMWPIHGKYICSRCLREHVVEWEKPVTAAEYGQFVQRPVPAAIESHVWAEQR